MSMYENPFDVFDIIFIEDCVLNVNYSIATVLWRSGNCCVNQCASCLNNQVWLNYFPARHTFILRSACKRIRNILTGLS